MTRPLFRGLLCGLLVSACSSSLQSVALVDQTPAALQSPVTLTGVPFFPQDAYQCGPAALATVLVATDIDVTPEQLVPLVYVPGRQGSFQVEMVAAGRSFGRLVYRIEPTLEALFTEISSGNPVLVMQNLGVSWYPQWHFAVVKGFDISRRQVILNSGTIEDYQQSLTLFERTWARSEYWAVVVLEPGTVAATAEPARYFTAVVELEQVNPPELVGPAYLAGLEKWSTDRELLMGHGNFLYNTGQPDAAADRFRQVIGHHPDFAPAYNNLAQILLGQGHHQQAREHALRAVELGGIYLDTYRNTLHSIETASVQPR